MIYKIPLCDERERQLCAMQKWENQSSGTIEKREGMVVRAYMILHTTKQTCS